MSRFNSYLSSMVSNLETDGYFKATNIIANGNFNGTTPWSGYGSALSAENNVLSVTSLANANPTALQTTGINYLPGKKIYIKATLTLKTTNGLSVSAFLTDGNSANTSNSVTISSPIKDTTYTLEGILTSPGTSGTGKIRLWFRTTYADAIADRLTEIKNVIALDLTSIFGTENEPTVEQVRNMLAGFTNLWFDGTKSFFTADELVKKYFLLNRSKWYGKKWSVVGDSLTEVNGTTTMRYHDIIKGILKCTVNNYGYSGTGWMTDYGGHTRVTDRLGEIAADSDLITIMLGTNDAASSVTIGVFGDTDPDASIFGAVDYTCRTLITAFPTKQIAIFTSPPNSIRWGVGSNLEQIADAVIKVGKHYSIPVLDLYRESSFSPWNADFVAYAMHDGTHPKEPGHFLLADKILTFLNSI